MGRPLRVLMKGVTYHVYSRCYNKEVRLQNRVYKNLMFQVITDVQKTLNFELNSIILMDNHFHMFITTVEDGPHIDVIMQRIKSIFARKYNKMNKRTGPFWNERYGAKIVEQQDNPKRYALYNTWYMAYNTTRRAEKVDPREYKYSSINCYLGKETFDKVKITLLKYYEALSDDVDERIKKFLEYEQEYLRIHPEGKLD